MQVYNFNIIKGNIFDYVGQADAICTTTNCVITAKNELVMGAGNAKEFKLKYPNLPRILANKLDNGEKFNQYHIADKNLNKPYIAIDKKDNNGTYVISFPTKYDYKDKSDIELIKRSAMWLVLIANEYDMKKIIVPSPGTSCGKLSKNEVYNMLNFIFDKRFYIISK